MTLADANLVGAQKLANYATKSANKIIPLTKVPILGALGTLTTGINAGVKLNEFFHDPKGHLIDGIEGAGTLIVAVVCPECLLAYNLITLGVDLYREFSK